MNNYSFAQILISGETRDELSGDSIQFVNIGIKNKNNGTISGKNGAFSIYITEKNLMDSLTFSKAGYNEKTLSLNYLLSANKIRVELEQQILQLETFNVLKKGKWKIKDYGIKHAFPGVFGEAISDTIGDILEVGQQINLDSILHRIISLHIFIRETNIDTVTFRINLHRFNSETSIERLLNKEIIVKQKINSGWLNINLTEQEIFLSGSIIASIEILATTKKDKIKLFYGGILSCKGTSFTRTSNQGAWYKNDFGTYAMYLKTKMNDTKN